MIEPTKRSSVALFLKNGLVLAVSRKGDHDDLGLPGGKVDPGESFEAAAIRETEEETGILVINLHEVFRRQCGEFDARTFQATLWEGAPKSMEEGAVVLWVPPQRLLEKNCSFRDYNLALFTKLNLI